jgi:hypothetical protein
MLEAKLSGAAMACNARDGGTTLTLAAARLDLSREERER